ncbi:MAG: hypothetical protein M0P69_09040 [Bacteroidales bacterium]|nr:hypothetical protein [Bacteroidales bacterium]
MTGDTKEMYATTAEGLNTTTSTESLLLDNFATLASAPGGVQRLRELILQLAVQGRLVPQDPADEPANVLLERIAAEKQRLVREGKIRKSKPLPPVEEVPYEVPEGWVWTRLGNLIYSMANGIYKPASFYAEDGIVCLRMYNIN